MMGPARVSVWQTPGTKRGLGYDLAPPPRNPGSPLSMRCRMLSITIALALSTAVPADAKDKDKEGWIELIKGNTLAESGWKLRRDPDAGHKNGWTLKDGVLSNKAPSIDLVHEKEFKDFDLHVEFRYPKGQNSGVYMRGVYEVQVEDTHGKPLSKTMCGAIYSLKAPSENAAKPAGEWQTFDIQLVGNKVTVIHNGKKVIDGFEIPNKTGSAPDKIKHGDPGPLMLQGDHGDVEYRNIRVRPIKS